jgi:excisionase family DNA binding protein
VNQVPQGKISVAEILAYIDRDRYMSLADATVYLALSERNLRQRLPEIPHYRVGTKLLFRKSHLDLWMERHREKAAAISLDKIAEEAFESVFWGREITHD